MRSLPLTLPVLFLWLQAWNPAPSVADEVTHRAELETLFRLTNMEARVREGVDNFLVLQLRQHPELAGREATLRDFVERYIGWEAMRPQLDRMYLEAFSEDELRAANAFYITPVGQKILNRIPELVRARNELAAQRLQEHIGELQQELDTAQAPR